jgi:glycosyltransferase involved in cell wall biosynthesis
VPRFSIIIPCYNSARWIQRTLDSVFCQPGDDFEVIVVDDGSTDDTSAILKGYRRRIEVMFQPNQGAGAARNLAVRKARGDYLATLDADDVWFPWTLRLYREAIARFNRPSIIAGTALRFKESAELTHLAAPVPADIKQYPNFYEAARDGFWFLLQGALAVRRDVFETCGGYAIGRINGEDTHLFMKFGLRSGFVALKSPALFGYRSHENNWAMDARRNFHGCLQFLREEKNGTYPGGTAYRWVRRGLLTKHTRPTSIACVKKGEYKSGLRLYGATLYWNMRLARLRYLLFFPLLFVWEMLNAHRRQQGHMRATRLE